MRRWMTWLMVASLCAGPVRPSSAGDAKKVSLDAYAEFRHGVFLIVDGQRVQAAANVDFKGEKAATSFRSIPLGYEVKVEGYRQLDGSILASKVRAKPNGQAMFEAELSQSFDQMEDQYRHRGRMRDLNAQGQVTQDLGPLYDSGEDVERVRHITRHLVPPYANASEFRVYVVGNREWNAMCAPNHSIYVFSGLLNAMDDDEVAIILAHELVHANYEHARKEYKKTMLITLAALGVAAVAESTTDNKNKKAVIEALALVGAMTWRNGYSRKAEDQADRVAMRYVHEAGYDVTKAPRLWDRFAQKYGDQSKTVNFFLGDHPLSRDRERTLAREIEINYKPGLP